MLLTGNKLGNRQRQLNEKVIEAAKENVDFNDVRYQKETCVVDKLFKIDLAAKYKNLDYILEIFKSGDSLYTVRALNKSTWLCNDEFADKINADYLRTNIFPLMSIKMRNKLLISLALRLKNDRAVVFYEYCMKLKLYNIALKFLLHTGETIKSKTLENSHVLSLIADMENEYLINFIGNSFPLAENYIKKSNNYNKGHAIYLLRYMYSISNEKYLSMLETCECDVKFKTIGFRLSKDIIKKYKSRVMNFPSVYVKVLKKNVISRHCTLDVAKVFAVALLPQEITRFWLINFYTVNQFVLDIIPPKERFSFVKQIFTEKYQGAAFETDDKFYKTGLYNIMTTEERENWALGNIQRQLDEEGTREYYIWYKFVNFKKAFVDIKKLLMKTTGKQDRCDILKVLIHSAKTQEDLTQLLSYYYDRHINEEVNVTNEFLLELLEKHKVLAFAEKTWTVFEKIFYSMYKSNKHFFLDPYKTIALLYYIINEKQVPEIFNEYLLKEFTCFKIYSHTLRDFVKNLEPEKKEKVFQYVLKAYAERVEQLSNVPYDDTTQENILNIIRRTITLIEKFGKTLNDIPPIMKGYIELNESIFESYSLFRKESQLTPNIIRKNFKENAEFVLTEFKKIINQRTFHEFSLKSSINWLHNKLQIYFTCDITEKYVALLFQYITNDVIDYIAVEQQVRGLLALADECKKTEFLLYYAPKEKKIDHSNISTKVLSIQRAICAQIYSSRPPLPLSIVFQYLDGDYVKYCLTLFSAYMKNLPNPQCVDFIKTTIDKPVSIQKHGLKLAFECFDDEMLSKIITDIWRKTKNVSLRNILYTLLFKKTETELNLFDLLIKLTLDLNEDDDEALFDLVYYSKFTHNYDGRYVEAAFKCFSKFPEKTVNLKRMVHIIKRIEGRSLINFPEETLHKIIEDHVTSSLDNKAILIRQDNTKSMLEELLKIKWELTAHSLVYIANDSKLNKNKELVRHIIKKCVEMWNEQNDGKYIVRYFLNDFIQLLNSKFYEHVESRSGVDQIFEIVLNEIKGTLADKEIYLLVWYLEASELTRKVDWNLNQTIKSNEDEAEAATRTSSLELGRAFGKLIKQYVDKKLFYSSLCYELQHIVLTNIRNLELIGMFARERPSLIDIQVFFCIGLLDIGIAETYIFASKLLPTDTEDLKCLNEYQAVIKKLQSCEYVEVQYYMYEKFVNHFRGA